MNKFFWTAIASGIALVAAIVSTILTFGGEQEPQESLVGVVIPGQVEELGWNGTHYKGIVSASQELGAKVLLIEDIKENSGLCRGAVDSLIHAGARMIILGSYNYADEIADVIRNHPEIMFYCCAASLRDENYKVYFARVYQARYLSGILAGLSTRNNRIGYVAAMNNIEVNRGINAFTLGARSVNPDARVFVAWTGSWDDAEREKANVDVLVDSFNVDLVTYHQNQDWVLGEAEARGILSIGYNLESTHYSEKVLSSVATNWNMVYREIIQDFFQKKKSISNYWIGLEKDAVGLSFYSPLVGDSIRQILDETMLKMKNGMEVFAGPLYDNFGKLRCRKDELLGDAVLRENMDWFVKGVELYEK